MSHKISLDDERFRIAFEAFEISPEAFNHRAHLRLAYIYLCDKSPSDAERAMKRSLLAFLNHVGAGEAKFHETMTSAWIDAVNHFMQASRPASAFDEFIDASPELLDSKIMLTHYSADLLFSDAARRRVVDPDISAIPKHG